MAEKFSNNAKSILAAAMLAGDTVLTVSDASTFPATGNFRIVIDVEILLVIAVAGPAFTVTRAYEPIGGLQVAAAHAKGAPVTHLLTAGSLQTLFAGSQAPTLGNVSLLGGF